MIKIIIKQFLYGRLYCWIKEKLSYFAGFLITILLILYFHSEFIKFIYNTNTEKNSIVAISYIIKNLLILIVVVGYYYFLFFINNSEKKFKEKITKLKQYKTYNKIKSLDYFLREEEL